MDALHDLPKAQPDLSVIDQDCVAYEEGFDDALGGEPLFDDATAEYRCGWLAYWDCVRLFNEMGTFKINGVWVHRSQFTEH